MWAFALAALVSGAPVFLEVREARGVSPEEGAELVRLFGAALESKAGVVVSRDESEVERLVLRALGVPTRIRLFCERSSPSVAPRVVEVDLPRARARWPGLVEGLVLELFPPSTASDAVSTAALAVATRPPGAASVPARVLLDSSPPRAIDPRLETTREIARVEPPWGPVISAGAGLVAGAVGVGFGLSSRAARDEARTQPRTDAEFEALEDRAIHHGVAANVLFGAAALGVVGGVVWYLLE